MKEDLEKIIKYYGIDNQLRKFNEEVFELNEAIIRYEEADYNWFENDITNTNYIKNITEEIADVQVMLDQLQHYYEISEQDVLNMMKFKINRQLDRINNENK
jgi:NTP pyrophosphatase (non-canonical NTP hydrolase)